MSFRAKKSNFQDFEQSLELGDVERVNIVNEKTIQVYIREESLVDSERYKEVRNSNLSKEINPGPHYFLKCPPQRLRIGLRIIMTNVLRKMKLR